MIPDVRCWQPLVHDAHDWTGNADLNTYHCDGQPFRRRAVSPDAPAARLTDQAAQPGATSEETS